MAAVNWIVMLLACNLIGLFDDMLVTTAPLHESKEIQNTDAIDSASGDIKDDVIGSTYKEDTHVEGVSDNETTKKGDGNASNMEGQEAGNGWVSGDTNVHSEITANPHANGDAESAQKVSDEEERGSEEKSSEENEEESSDDTLSEGENRNNPVSELENKDVNERSHELEKQESGTDEEIKNVETDDDDDVSLTVNDDKTGHDENVEGDGKAHSSSNELNQGSSANSEQGINDEDQKSSELTELTDSELPAGVHDNSNLPITESPATALKAEQDNADDDNNNNNDDNSEGGSVAKDQDDNLPDSPEPVSGEVHSGAQAAAGAVHSAEAPEHAEEVAAEANKNDNDEHEISQGNDSGAESSDNAHSALHSSSEDGNVDQNSSEGGNAAGGEEVLTQEVKEDVVDGHDASGSEAASDVHGALGSSSEGGTADENSSAGGSGAEVAGSPSQEVKEDVDGNDASGSETSGDVHDVLDPLPEGGTADENSSAGGNGAEVAGSPSQEVKEGDEEDHDVSEKGDFGTDTIGDVPHTSDTSSAAGTENQNLTMGGSGHIVGSNVQPEAESDGKKFSPAGRSSMPLPPDPSSANTTSNDKTSTNHNYLTENVDVPASTQMSKETGVESTVAANANVSVGTDEEGKFGTSAEDVVTETDPGSGNNTLLIPRVGSGDKTSGEDDGINEPGLGSQGGDSVSSGSIGSYIVLGVILAIILVLLGYSMFKGRGTRARESKNEDFGTEMAEVKTSLLHQNDFKRDIKPSTLNEEDESKAKLLTDAQVTGDNIKNGEAGVTVRNSVDSQKELGGIYDASTEKKTDFDKIESLCQPMDSSENTLISQKQINTNPFRDAITQKKLETPDDQSTHQHSVKTPTHQTAYNNVNGFPEEVVENVTVQKHGGYFTQNSGVPAVHGGLQQQNVGTVYSPVLPTKVVTVVEQGCTPSKPVFINVERTSIKY